MQCVCVYHIHKLTDTITYLITHKPTHPVWRSSTPLGSASQGVFAIMVYVTGSRFWHPHDRTTEQLISQNIFLILNDTWTQTPRSYSKPEANEISSCSDRWDSWEQRATGFSSTPTPSHTAFVFNTWMSCFPEIHPPMAKPGRLLSTNTNTQT